MTVVGRNYTGSPMVVVVVVFVGRSSTGAGNSFVIVVGKSYFGDCCRKKLPGQLFGDCCGEKLHW